MDYKKEAASILEAIGGKENVAAAAHCATRLRLVLNDESKVDEKALEQLDVVKGTFSTGGQYQQGLCGIFTIDWPWRHVDDRREVSRSEKNEPAPTVRQNVIGYLRSNHPGHRRRRSLDGNQQLIDGTGFVL